MARKPQIVLSSLDVDRIEALIAAMPASVFPGKMELQAELDRADVVAPEEIPPKARSSICQTSSHRGIALSRFVSGLCG